MYVAHYVLHARVSVVMLPDARCALHGECCMLHIARCIAGTAGAPLADCVYASTCVREPSHLVVETGSLYSWDRYHTLAQRVSRHREVAERQLRAARSLTGYRRCHLNELGHQSRKGPPCHGKTKSRPRWLAGIFDTSPAPRETPLPVGAY